MTMQIVDGVYQIWQPGVDSGKRYFELRGLKTALQEAGFRWTESTGYEGLNIHRGGDILSDNRYKIGELRGNSISVLGSSELEDFLEQYPD
jgi:hypothetical protein